MQKQQVQPPDFLITPYALIADDTLNSLDRTVYSVIYWFTHLRGERCFAGNSIIADIARCEESSVRRCLTALEKAGYIERIFKTGKHSERKEIIPLITMQKSKARKHSKEEGLTPRDLPLDPARSTLVDPAGSYNSNNTTESSIITEQRDKEKHIINIGVARSTNAASMTKVNPVSGEKTVSEGTQVNELIDAFQTVNTRYDQFFKHKTQRDALQRLLKQFSFSQLQKAVSILPETNGQPFAPVITSPVELEMKMSKLISFVKREKIKAATPKGKQIVDVNKK
ncbi:TPA: hypothetical protein DIU22_02090 [Candidatus Woesebacteria bacterium]|nr:hypothetical protein [Candidatus Woesebacteria bacterium]